MAVDRRRATLNRLSQIFLIVAVFAGLWAGAVAVAGGVLFRAGALRISSQQTRNPLAVAMISGCVAWVLATRDARRRALSAVWACLRGHRGPLLLLRQPAARLAPALAAAAAVIVVILGLVSGAFVAGGADSYGYVSQADLWIRGSLIVEQPFARNMTWPNAAASLAPLGYRPYRPGAHGGDLVPIYASGLPMMMAGFKRVGGPRAVFYVVPILGGLAVWATYLMGVRVGGRLVGLAAAVLLATSPPFLFELLSPTSDVPVTAWWAVALVLVVSGGRASAFGAGLAAGAAILTRPNLVPLAAIPGLWLAWRAARSGGSVHRALLFAAGTMPACVAIAVINQRLYGSPLLSGYGTLDALYQWRYLSQNLAHYPRWLVDAQTPLVAVALVAPFLVRPHGFGRNAAGGSRSIAIMWLCFIGAVFLSYLFYIPFDDWTYLRFMLPAYPPLLVLTSVGLVAAATRVFRRARVVSSAIVVAVLACHGLNYSLERSWPVSAGEQRYAGIGEYIATHLPERAALLSMQHSGSVRYYSGRLTVRYDVIGPEHLDFVIEELRRLGYRPYLVLDDWEEPRFRTRFQGRSRLASLDWVPVAMFRSGTTKIYDLPDRRDPRSDRVTFPDVIR